MYSGGAFLPPPPSSGSAAFALACAGVPPPPPAPRCPGRQRPCRVPHGPRGLRAGKRQVVVEYNQGRVAGNSHWPAFF